MATGRTRAVNIGTVTPTAAAAPARTRNVDTAPKLVTAKMKAQAKQFYEQNNKANAFTNAAKKTRAALLADMDKAEVPKFSTGATLEDGKTVTLDVLISEPEKSAIDVEALFKLVDQATFLKIVSASLDAVTTHAGSIIAGKCSKATKGSRNVTVKPAK